MTQFHADLTHRHTPSRYDISPGGLARLLGLGIAVAAGLGAYILVAFAVSARLHLERDAAFSMGFGVLCLLASAFGWGRYLVGRRLENWGEGAITIYVVAIGIALFGAGLWRQIAVVHARQRCREALVAADDLHARLLVYRTNEHLPTLDSHRGTVTCEQLLHALGTP